MAQSLTNLYCIPPARLTASENPVYFKFYTDESDTTPQKPQHAFYISESSTISSGDYVLVNNKKFSCASISPNSNDYYASSIENEQQSESYDKTNLQIVESMAYAFKTDSTLNAEYDIWHEKIGTLAYVFLRAKVASSKYNINLNASNATNINLTTSYYVEGSNAYEGDGVNDLGFYLNLYAINDEMNSDNDIYDMNAIQTLTVPYNTRAKDNIHKIDVSSILKSYVTTDIQQGLDNWYNAEAILNFACEYGAYYPEVNNIQRNHSFGLSKNINEDYLNDPAVATKRDFYMLNSSLNKTLTNSLNTSYRLLFNTDLTKFIEEEEDIVFSVFSNSSQRDDEIEVKVGLAFQDGTYTYDIDDEENTMAVYTTLTGDTVENSYDGVYTVKIRWEWIENNFGLNASNEGKKLFWLKMNLYSSGDISDALMTNYTYYYRRENINSNSINIVYLNDIGGFENYTFTGEVQTDLNTKSIDYIKNKTENENLDQLLSTKSVESTKTLKLTSQPLSDEQFDDLIQLVKSTKIYILQNSVFLPIKVGKIKYSDKTLDDLTVIELTVEDSISENSITQ